MFLFKLCFTIRSVHTGHTSLSKVPKERFYEAGILISEPESAENKPELYWEKD